MNSVALPLIVRKELGLYQFGSSPGRHIVRRYLELLLEGPTLNLWSDTEGSSLC